MNLVLVVFHETYTDDVRQVLESLAVPGYTEYRGLRGSGETGRRLDTGVWPGRNSAVMAVVSAEETDRVVEALKAFKATLPAPHGRPGGMKIFVLPVLVTA